jgi:hypothetical protein
LRWAGRACTKGEGLNGCVPEGFQFPRQARVRTDKEEEIDMRHMDPRKIVLSGCVIALLTGCSQLQPVASTGTTNPSSPQPTPSPEPNYSVGVSLSRPSVIVGTMGWLSTLVYKATDSGKAPAYASLEGCHPAVDGQGNVYLLAFHYPNGCGTYPSSIDVYPPNAVGGASRLRSLPVGPGTRIESVVDMAVSPKGEIFVNDGSGVAVFSATANGNDAPVRYIQWDGGGKTPVPLGFIAVDGKGDLYIQNGLSIGIFGPEDTGLMVPPRVISGPHTQLYSLGRMTADGQGNLYVTTGDGFGNVILLEFSANANGNVLPVSSLSSPLMEAFDGSMGVAVDSSGLIYVRATDPYCGAIFVFASNSSGGATPLRVLDKALPCPDIDGTIAVY